jgi:hypothetical protein
LRLTPANASLTQKWKLDDKGRIISLFNGYAVTRGTGGARSRFRFEIVLISTPTEADNQKFTTETDYTMEMSGFVLRTKLNPELNLVMQIFPSENQVRLAEYTGSDEQRWILTPTGYVVSCKTINGLKLFLSSQGKFHGLLLDHAS